MINVEPGMKTIARMFQEAQDYALLSVEVYARQILRENPELDEFVMEIGGAYFIAKDRNVFSVWAKEEFDGLARLLDKWDYRLSLSDHPMRFTATGAKQTEW